MKKLIFILLFVPFICNGQDRVNAALPVISEPIYTMWHADGWSYSDYNGQWNKRENDIVGYDDFKKIEIRKMTLGEENYFILLKYINDGYFDYPTINEGFHSVVTINFYAFKSKNVYDAFSSIKDSIFVLKFQEAYKGSIIESQIDNLGSDILRFKVDDSKERNLFMQIQLSNSKNFFRFLFFEKECYYPTWEKEHIPENQICSYYRKKEDKIYEFDKYFKLLGTDKIFTSFYFETEYPEYLKFKQSFQ